MGLQSAPESMQYELMKSELAEHFQLKSEHGRLQAKAKLMEEVIVTLKGENDELKRSRCERVGRPSIFKKDLKGIVFAYERDRLTSVQKQNLMQHEIRNLKAHLDEYHSETTLGSDRSSSLSRALELAQELVASLEKSVQGKAGLSQETVEALVLSLEELLRGCEART
jgi:hypothetical protein